MARVAKVDNSLKKRLLRKEAERSVANRSKRVYFLIVCEGEKTEPLYFEAIKQELSSNQDNGTHIVVEATIKGTGKNTIGVVEEAIRLRDNAQNITPYDRVWAVFDRDSFPAKNFDNAIEKAKANNISCAWSNEAFELWYLLHFQYYSSKHDRGQYSTFLEEQVNKKLKGKNKNAKRYKYQKNAENTLKILREHGSQKQAIIRAKKLEKLHTNKSYNTHNPCTKVYLLVDELFHPEIVLKKIEQA